MKQSEHTLFKQTEWRMIWGFVAMLIASPLSIAMLTSAMMSS
jgi:hypothetical protein